VGGNLAVGSSRVCTKQKSPPIREGFFVHQEQGRPIRFNVATAHTVEVKRIVRTLDVAEKRI
jgi:hypothetical protein